MNAFPSWAPPIFRAILAVALLFIGVSGWADGYGMAVVTIGTALLVAELVGAGLSASQAAQIAAYVAALEAQLAARSGAQAPADPPVPPA